MRLTRKTITTTHLSMLLAFVFIVGSACAQGDQLRKENSEAPRWVKTIPAQSVRPGGEAVVVDLGAYYAGLAEVTGISSVVFESLDPVAAHVVSSPVDGKPTAVSLSATGETSARRFVAASLRFDDGTSDQAVIVVDCSSGPGVTFTFKPASGSPANVFVAGSFNGWNASADRLEGPDEQGVFTAKVSVTPGRHSYKLVVDGNWITDPANPDGEDDGFGGKNSILNVAGSESAKTIMLLPLGPEGGGSDSEEPPVISHDPLPDSSPWIEWLIPILIGKLGEEIGRQFEGSVFFFSDQTNTKDALEGEDLRPCLILAGNRLLRTPQSADDDNENENPECWFGSEGEEGTVVMLMHIEKIYAQSPDGIIRVMLQDDAGTWAEATIHGPPQPHMQPDWRGRTIYFALTDRFANGNPENDNPIDDVNLRASTNYAGGDWAGLRAKIEEGYFDELGVGALWISAPNMQVEAAEKESVEPGNYYSAYHGYWPASPTETNPHFGSMEELRALVTAAHEHDIYVLLDLVANHTHESHPWRTEHPEWYGSLALPGGGQNIRQYDAHPFTTWFDSFLPAFDFEASPAAVDALAENAVWWIKQTGIDGFRQDAVKHIQPLFWRALTRRMRDDIELPEARRLFQVGETISGRGTIMEFVSGEMLDGQFDFPLYWTLREALGSNAVGLDRLASEIQSSIDEYGPEALMSPLIGNHDVSRFMAFADGDLTPGDGQDEKIVGWDGAMTVNHGRAYDRLVLAQALTLTLPGCPMIYYGDEIGLTGAGDPDNRRPMRFGDELTDRERATLASVRELGRIRKASPALKYGNYQELMAETDTLAFARVSIGRGAEKDQTIVSIIHRGRATEGIEIDLPLNLAGATSAEILYPLGARYAEAGVDGSKLTVVVPGASAMIVELH